MSHKSKERPILFSAPMVNAILEGRKVQTRRVVKDCGSGVHLLDGPEARRWPMKVNDHGGFDYLPCPYGKAQVGIDGQIRQGDRLWVRESTKENCTGSVSFGRYSADEAPVFEGFDRNPESPHKWAEWWYSRKSCPSIHMPRWASRILLEITGVRVERLNDISREDAENEGLKKWPHKGDFAWGYDGGHEAGHNSPTGAFMALWESINGADSWKVNPWVWVVEFKRV